MVEMSEQDTAPELSFVGGNLALDFTNTVSYQFAAPQERRDKLKNYEILLMWAEQGGAISRERARALRRAAAGRAAEAAAVLEEARALRDAIFRLFYARSRDEVAPAADLALVNRALAVALAHRRLELRDGAYVLDFDRDGDDLDAPLWPVAAAAAELLTSEGCGRVRVCSAVDEDCSWLFVDDTRNHSRRWCTMKDCGNRAKARRHYARAKVGPTSRGS
jgi:predicted RNA-binding Zn ribbon-like protein